MQPTLAVLATLRTAVLVGIEAALVRVEVDVGLGLPSFSVVGLPDASIRESRDRVRSAVRNVGLDFPLRRITVNLAPADLRKVGPFLLAFGIVMPLLHGTIVVWLGQWAGLSLGGATLFGTLAASASYIAAPAAIRVSLPDANPTLYRTSALAITFPFNIALGIPVYFEVARWLFGAP